MGNIIIVECMSTGVNYVQDVMDRNHNPIVLELTIQDDSEEGIIYKNHRSRGYEAIDCEFDMIYEKESYEETLAMVKEYDPLLVVAGAEMGVTLATKLANDLGLLCNPIENLPAMTFKDVMQNRLAENGLRHIKGKVISSVEDALEFYESEKLNEVVVKPVKSAGSVGVKICTNKQEIIEAIDEISEMKGYGGADFNGILIQERIDGVEYIVNTVSCDGIHRVTTIWKYEKIKTSDGSQVYDTASSVNELGLGESELVEYVYDVLDAIGIKYGPVHGEYMIDENGPVLIEVNCRPSGPDMEANFLDRFSGQHETDSALDSYLNPNQFAFHRLKGYNLFGHAVIKTFIVPRDIDANSSPINQIGIQLKSHYKTVVADIDNTRRFFRTHDLDSNGGLIYLVHEDGYQIQKDRDFLKSLEKQAFQLVLSEGLNTHRNKTVKDGSEELKSILTQLTPYGTILLVTEEKFDDVNTVQVTYDELDEVKGNFDCVVVNLNESLLDKKDDLVAGLFLKIFNKVKISGLIFIPKNTYDYLPNERRGAEALVRALDFKIELPSHHFPHMLIASKR